MKKKIEDVIYTAMMKIGMLVAYRTVQKKKGKTQ